MVIKFQILKSVYERRQALPHILPFSSTFMIQVLSFVIIV